MDIVEKARIFATAAHHAIGQVRKYTGEPYINHPAEVVSILMGAGIESPEMLAAAWLHDVVEDTDVSLVVIAAEFGSQVAELVCGMTDISVYEDGNRATRRAIDRNHTAAQSPACKTIKLADIIGNARTIVEQDSEFAKVYLAENRQLLEVIREGNQKLWNEANDICQQSDILETNVSS
jgi:guanosine-3',5'-bis(diphosphate) 3'-pyrophosphohydrolase